jgi:ComF family protein
MHFLRQLLSASMLCDLPGRLLPAACALCGTTDGDGLCKSCRARYFSNAATRCQRCASELPTGQALCGRCQSAPPAFDASFAAAVYAPPIDAQVLALKFRGQLPYAAVFASLILQSVAREAMADADVLIAVPLSTERLAARGFNQAHEIAKPLARAWQLPLMTEACVRVRDTEPQSALAPDRRRDNMRGAFAVARSEAVAGRHVLVVDDVMTTGHTLDALAACLKRNGATRVTNLVFARTPLR